MGHTGARTGAAVMLAAVWAGAAAAQESPYLYGIHDAQPSPQEFLNHCSNAGITGWVTATVAVGHNPADMSGADFRSLSGQGHAVICRINNAYCDLGTIPLPADYAAFATRCANFVQNSQGCSIWVIGNETNLASEWPPSGGRKAYVSPQDYANCFRQVYTAIKAVRPAHRVVPQALAPWAGPYGTGTEGCGMPHDAMPLNWVQYMNQMLTAIAGSGPGPDGIALHITSRGYGSDDVHSTQKVTAGGQSLYWSFYVYKDWINLGIPSSLYSLPLYATECNGLYYWKGGHPKAPAETYQAGWMQAIYAEINRYNTVEAPAAGKPLFHCVNLYRWCSNCDPWNIDGAFNKPLILSDLDQAIAYRYRWNAPPVADFTGAPFAGPAPLTVSFTDLSTGAVDTRAWSFGDGASSPLSAPAHTYANPGSYTVGLTVTGPYGSSTKSRAACISVAEPAACSPYLVADFEENAAGAQAVFRAPRVSPTTSAHLAASPDGSVVTDEIPAFSGTRACRIQWAFVDAATSRWLRLTTGGTANRPNPAVDLRRPLRLRLRLDSGSLRICAGVRETGVDVPVGNDGGTTGTIEWIGCSAAPGGVPQGVLVQALPGAWQTVVLGGDAGAVQPFTGDGVLGAAGNKGVLEHLALSSAGGAGPFTLYVDAVTHPCPPRGDFDRDGDVDQADFGHLQSCLSGAGLPQGDAGCQDARLDGDSDVDIDDLDLFRACLSGPGRVPAALCFN